MNRARHRQRRRERGHTRALGEPWRPKVARTTTRYRCCAAPSVKKGLDSVTRRAVCQTRRLRPHASGARRASSAALRASRHRALRAWDGTAEPAPRSSEPRVERNAVPAPVSFLVGSLVGSCGVGGGELSLGTPPPPPPRAPPAPPRPAPPRPGSDPLATHQTTSVVPLGRNRHMCSASSPVTKNPTNPEPTRRRKRVDRSTRNRFRSRSRIRTQRSTRRP